MICRCSVLFSLSFVFAFGQPRIRFDLERTSQVEIALGPHEKAALLWQAPVENIRDRLGREEKLVLLSLSTPDNVMFWTLLPIGAKPGFDAIAHFDGHTRYVADERSVRCFTAAGSEIHVRTGNEKVMPAERREYLRRQLLQIQDPLSWAFMNSFDRIPLGDVTSIRDLLLSGGLGGPPPDIRIEQARKTDAGYQLGLRHPGGLTAVLILSDDLRVISAKMNQEH